MLLWVTPFGLCNLYHLLCLQIMGLFFCWSGSDLPTWPAYLTGLPNESVQTYLFPYLHRTKYGAGSFLPFLLSNANLMLFNSFLIMDSLWPGQVSFLVENKLYALFNQRSSSRIFGSISYGIDLWWNKEVCMFFSFLWDMFCFSIGIRNRFDGDEIHEFFKSQVCMEEDSIWDNHYAIYRRTRGDETTQTTFLSHCTVGISNRNVIQKYLAVKYTSRHGVAVTKMLIIRPTYTSTNSYRKSQYK